MSPAEAVRLLRSMARGAAIGLTQGHHQDRLALLAGADALEQLQATRDRLADYENAINWGVSCTSCARVLDASIADHERAEQAEARSGAILEEVERLRLETAALRAKFGDAIYDDAVRFHAHIQKANALDLGAAQEEDRGG